MEAGRRADAREASHEQAQIQAAGVYQEALADVGVPSQMHAAQPPGLVEMRVGSLEPLPALAQQPPSAGPPNPPPVGIHGVADGELASPASAATVRLGHIAAQPQVGQRDHRLIAVAAIVGDHRGHAVTRPGAPLRPARPP